MFDIVWHGNYARYLEVARCKLLDEIDYNYLQMRNTGFVFPIVDMKIRFVKPLNFKQKVLVQIKLKEWQHWLKFHYLILDATSRERHAKCMTRQVAVKKDNMILLDECPQILISRVEAAMQRAHA